MTPAASRCVERVRVPVTLAAARSPLRRCSYPLFDIIVTRSLITAAIAALLVLASACSDPAGTDRPSPEHVHYASISAGKNFTCGLSTAGVAYCWGAGVPGDSARSDTSGTPRRVDGPPFVELQADEFACARTAAGEAYCWWPGRSPQPVAPGKGLLFASLARPAPFSLGCGIEPSQALACWTEDSLKVTKGPYLAIAPGANCLLDAAGHILCTQHPLTDYHGWQTFRPTFVAGDSLSTFTSIGGGVGSACALRTDGAAECSTRSAYGCCGAYWLNGFAAVPGGHTFTQLSAASVHACGLDATGTAWCWGQGAYYGENHPIGEPAPVLGAPPFVQVSASAGHACGVTASGDAYCWGDNSAGQLGGGTVGGSSAAPVKVVDAVTRPAPS